MVWLIGKEKHPSLDAHGKEALNFNLTFAIAWAVLFLFAMLFMFGAPLFLAQGPLLLPFAMLPLLFLGILALGVTWLILVVIASTKAAAGELYRYPFAVRFIR